MRIIFTNFIIIIVYCVNNSCKTSLLYTIIMRYFLRNICATTLQQKAIHNDATIREFLDTIQIISVLIIKSSRNSIVGSSTIQITR